jgi:hypothetical protein
MVPTEVAPAGPIRRATAPFDTVEDGTPVRKLEFVEVGAGPVKTPRRTPASAATAEAEAFTPAPVSPGEPRWSLWGDAEV